MREIAISTTEIKLDQLLKWGGMAATGGQARVLIASGGVMVNGVVVRARHHRVRPGDTVAVHDQGEFKITAG